MPYSQIVQFLNMLVRHSLCSFLQTFKWQLAQKNISQKAISCHRVELMSARKTNTVTKYETRYPV